jgi:hypothetical protein
MNSVTPRRRQFAGETSWWFYANRAASARLAARELPAPLDHADRAMGPFHQHQCADE